MLRRTIPFCLIMITAMGGAKALANPVTISHTQTTLGEEELGSIPNDTAKIPVNVTVTNNTGIDWTDYTIRIASLSGSTLLLISSFTVPADPFDAGSRSKDKLSVTYYDGTLANTKSFTANLVVAYVDTSVTFYGTPSVGGPEPSTLLLFGAGLAALAGLSNRNLRGRRKQLGG
jgi:hypothetical protein